MEEAISATSDTGTSWDAQLAENSDMDIDMSTDNIDEIMTTLGEYTSITPPMDENNTLLPNQQHTENQLRELIETFTGADSTLDTYLNLPNQPEETNQMMNTVDASWLSFDQSIIDTNEASNQQQDLMPVAEETWVPDTVTNPNIVQANLQLVIRNHYLITKDLLEINHIIPVTDQIISATDPFWLAETINTNQVLVTEQIIPVTNQIIPVTNPFWSAETMNTNQVPVTDQIIPVTDLSWSAETMNANQVPVTDQIIPDTDLSWSAETMNANQVPESSQAEPMDFTMPTAEPPRVELGTQPVVNSNQVGLQWGEVALVYPNQGTSSQLEANDTTMPTADNAEAAWEVHPYFQASMESLNDPQISEQQPLECTRNSPGPSATIEEVQTSYQAENGIIAIPLITDPNTTPKIITFRPGIYEGDAIPPMYSNFTIFAAPSGYKPPLRSPIYPELTIIPESIPENQIVAGPINPGVETTVDHSGLEEPLNSGSREPAKDIEEQELLNNTSVPPSKTKSCYRGIDAKLLSTLRQVKLILVYKGFHYSRYFSCGKKICWRCVSRKCKAFLYTVGNKITMTYPRHNHLTVISQETMNQEIKPDVDLDDGDLNDADSTLNEAENALDSNMIFKDYLDNFDNNYVLTSVNNKIPHDPSLEITVKSPLVLKETNEDLASSVTNTMIISGPDPLAICVTSYTPPIPNEASDLRNCRFCNAGIPSKINHIMSVPKDNKVKVTISTKPRISKPRIYYDGKLAPQSTQKKSNKSKSTSLQSTVPTTSQEATIRIIGITNAPYMFPPAPPGIPTNSENTRNSLRYAQDTNSISTASTSAGILIVPLRTIQNPYMSSANVPLTPATENIQTLNVAPSSTNTLLTTYTNTTYSLTGNIATARPLRNIPSSQIVTTSDPEDNLTFNTFVSQALTPELNIPLAVTTSAGSGIFSQSSLSPTVSTTTARSTVQRPGLNASTRTSNLVTVPRPRTMIPTGYTHQRSRLARARNVKPNSQRTKSD